MSASSIPHRFFRGAPLLLALGVAAPAGATSYLVPSDYSLDDAQIFAESGDVIEVEPGTYYGRVYLRDGVTLRGQDVHTEVLDGEDDTAISIQGQKTAVENLTALGDVGGLICAGGSTVAEGCLFMGGEHAIFADNEGDLEIVGCTVDGSTTHAVGSNRSTLRVHGCLVTNAGTDGITSSYSEAEVTNTVVTHCGEYGIRLVKTTATISNVTLVDNGTGFYAIDGQGSMRNAIISGSSGISMFCGGGLGVEPEVAYLLSWDNGGLAQGCTPEVGYIEADPMFVDTKGSSGWEVDLHLQAGSPAIDAGDPDSAYNDPDGSRNDLGAYGGPGAGSCGLSDEDDPTTTDTGDTAEPEEEEEDKDDTGAADPPDEDAAGDTDDESCGCSQPPWNLGAWLVLAALLPALRRARRRV